MGAQAQGKPQFEGTDQQKHTDGQVTDLSVDKDDTNPTDSGSSHTTLFFDSQLSPIQVQYLLVLIHHWGLYYKLAQNRESESSYSEKQEQKSFFLIARAQRGL